MKNLAKHKDKVNARNLVVQAMYEFSFGHNSAEEIEESFRKNFTKTKVDYIFFRNVFQHAAKNFQEYEKLLMEKSDLSLFGIESIERMEKNILIMAISESATEKTPNEILLDESVRLSKKFGSDNSYKFVNASLEQILNSE